MITLFTIAAHAAPDLLVSAINPICIAPNIPGIEVVVKNNSANASAGFYIDLWRDLPAPPPIGTAPGERYEWVPALPGFGSYIWKEEFANYPGWSGWVDVLVDTDNFVIEANEANNHRDRLLTFLPC